MWFATRSILGLLLTSLSTAASRMFFAWYFLLLTLFLSFLAHLIRLIVSRVSCWKHHPEKFKVHDFWRGFLTARHSFCCNSTTIHLILFSIRLLCRPCVLQEKSRHRLLKLLQGLRSKFRNDVILLCCLYKKWCRRPQRSFFRLFKCKHIASSIIGCYVINPNYFRTWL